MKLQEVMWCAGCQAEYMPIQLRRGKGCCWCERYAVTGDTRAARWMRSI